jgi:hypothetical protein
MELRLFSLKNVGVGFVASLACAPVVAALATAGDGNATYQSVQTCPNALTEEIFVAGCLPSVSPPESAVDLRGTGELPTLYGIPCTGSNSGQCIGLSRLT